LQIKLISECEVQENGVWRKIGIEEGLARRGALLRCPVCHGRMAAHKESHHGWRAFFGHMKGHTGCPTTRQFKGVVSMHPDALE
jgi:hypothetical protein